MTLHHMKLNPEPYRKIRQGKKTIELRLYDEKRRKLKVGDIIEFVNIENKELSVKARVLALHIFPSFKELYENLPLDKCGYTENNINIASYKDMEKFYSLEEQDKYGVVGIELEIESKLIRKAFSELIDIQKNEDTRLDWENCLAIDVWEDKYFG